MTSPASFAVAVLAGGSSRRMGRDKALIEIDGDAMVLRVVAEAGDSDAAEVVVVGREPHMWAGIDSVPDAFPGEGPLGGLISALRSTSAEAVVLAPCDLLHPSRRPIARIINELQAQASVDVVVPLVDNRRQYVQGAFRRQVLPHIERRFSAGERSIHGALVGLQVAELVFHEPEWFADADMPGDLPIASRQDDFGEQR